MSLKSIYDKIVAVKTTDTIKVYDKKGNFKKYVRVNIHSYTDNDVTTTYAGCLPCIKDGNTIYRSHYTKVDGNIFDIDKWLPNSKFKTHKWISNTKRFVPIGCSEYTINKNAFILVKINTL